MAASLSLTIYGVQSYSSSERGINENIEGLIRHYFLKDIDLDEVIQEPIDFVMDRTNN
jgi:IS30 family transposase